MGAHLQPLYSVLHVVLLHSVPLWGKKRERERE